MQNYSIISIKTYFFVIKTLNNDFKFVLNAVFSLNLYFEIEIEHTQAVLQHCFL